MKISTKGRYALRIMIDLAQHKDMGYISLTEIAKRQEISIKYLEIIVSTLNKANFVKSQRGKAGGYKLAKEPQEYTVGSILKLTEGSLAPVSCLECAENTCDKKDSCFTLPMWEELDQIIDKYLESKTLSDLLCKSK